jgi:tartrate-resistant acid phosphatase type 5
VNGRARLGPALIALCTACGCCGHGSPTYTVRHDAARSPPAAPPLSVTVRALHLADFGDDTCQQAAVAGAVAEAHRRDPLDLALFPGDNLYQCGPDPALAGAEGCRFGDDENTVAAGFAPPADPTFRLHEEPLAALVGIPVYLALGNHDVAATGGCSLPGDPAGISRLRACLEVAHASPLWTMPARHYVVDQGPARFIVVDSNVLTGDYGGFTFQEEEAFVAGAALGCDGRACFLVGHHPPATAGVHRDDATPDYLARADRLVQAGGGRIRAWLAGHDHALEHLRTAAGLDVLVSGNGARGRPSQRFSTVSAPGATLLFASVRWGYAILEVGAEGWRYRFEGDDGAALYCCSAVGSGRCEPVSCHDER